MDFLRADYFIDKPALSLMQKLCCHNFTTVIILIDTTKPIDKLILETFQGIIRLGTQPITLKFPPRNLQLADQSESWILNLIL